MSDGLVHFYQQSTRDQPRLADGFDTLPLSSLTDRASFPIASLKQNENVPSSHRQPTTDPSTRPGAYWFWDKTMSHAVLANVHRKNGELTVLWIGLDVPLADLNDHWRGVRSLHSIPVGGSVRSRASWPLTHGQRPRECEVSHYRHGCDPPELAESVLDCDTAPFSHPCVSDPPYLRPNLSPLRVLSAPPPDWANPISFYGPGRA